MCICNVKPKHDRYRDRDTSYKVLTPEKRLLYGECPYASLPDTRSTSLIPLLAYLTDVEGTDLLQYNDKPYQRKINGVVVPLITLSTSANVTVPKIL